MTIILIAHRLSTLSSADEIYVLDQGEIVEFGSFKDLSSNKDSLISCPNCNENFTIEDEIYNCYEKYENTVIF